MLKSFIIAFLTCVFYTCVRTVARSEKCVYTFATESAICRNVISLIEISQEIRPEWKHVKIDNTPGYFSIGETSTVSFGYVEDLNLSNAVCVDIPEIGFQHFTSLQILNLASSSISAIGDGWFSADVCNISELNLSHNKITILRRQQFRNLKKLRSLNIMNNSIESIEEDVLLDAPYLEYLNLCENRLRTIVSFGEMRGLRSLNLGKNSIHEIPSNIFQRMESLIDLSLEENQITDIREGAFIGLDNLYTLNLSANSIREITPKTFPIKRLNVLDISYNSIDTIRPFAFQELRDLIKLNLCGNKLVELDDDTFYGLVSLNLLLLQKNKIQNILPNTFSHLYAINSIELYGNYLQTLHGNIFGEQALPLKKLFIQRNKIKNIQRGTFVSVRRIDFLALSHNQIERLDDDLFEPLTNLRKLHLQDNRISELPQKLVNDIKRVIELQIQHNKLTFLPELKSIFGNLEKIAFDGNPWQCACLREIFDFITTLSQTRHVECLKENNPFYLGAKPLCYEPPVNPPSTCIRDMNFIQEYRIVELYEDALRG